MTDDSRAELAACLSLQIATLRALASSSPAMGRAICRLLDEDIDRYSEQGPARTVMILAEARARLLDAQAEAQMAQALERALLKAADEIMEEQGVRQAGGSGR